MEVVKDCGKKTIARDKQEFELEALKARKECAFM